MYNDFEELVQDFVKERTSKAIVELRTENAEYQKAFRKMVDNSEAAEKIRQNDFSLSADEFNSLKIYINAMSETGFVENLTVYMAGCADCVKLLKKLEVL